MFCFFRVFPVYVLYQMWLIRGKGLKSNRPLLVGAVQAVAGVLHDKLRAVKPQPTLLTSKRSQLMKENTHLHTRI